MARVPITRDQYFNLIQDSYGEKAFQGEYDVDNNLIYAAFALPGADTSKRVWQIKLLTYVSTNLTEVQWPLLNGVASTSYEFAWNDRATYTYQ